MSSSTLHELEKAVKNDLQVLGYPGRSGIQNITCDRQGTPAEVCNVAIIGGGQSGLAVAGALKLEKVENVRVFDQYSEEKVGPWLRFARMQTLRTPKNLPGPNLGIPNLTVRRWYEAVNGKGSWDSLEFISKEDWAAYLMWFRRVMEIEVEYETRITSIDRDTKNNWFVLSSRKDAEEATFFARRIVLATGIEGSGEWHTPDFIKNNLPSHLYAHTSENIDFESLRGKRVGILGAGASGFDNASVCLEHGAAAVDLCFRRPKLVDVNTFRWAEFMEFLKHFPDLDDRDKWRYITKIIEIGQLPPRNTLNRAKQFDAFTLRPGTPWDSVEHNEGQVLVKSGDSIYTYDFIIAATGFRTDLSLRPELSRIYEHIQLWGDAYTPDNPGHWSDLLRHPYLGPHFEFLAKNGAAPWISHIFNYTYGGLLSLGFGGASITGMKYSLSRIIDGITGSFFTEDAQYHYTSLCSYDEKEF